MKIRDGFVSNSSSSSFVVTTTKENWEKIKKGLSNLQVRVAEHIMKEDKFVGIDIVHFQTWESHSSGWEDMAAYILNGNKEPSKAFEHEVQDAWQQVERRLLENKDLVTTSDTEWH